MTKVRWLKLSLSGFGRFRETVTVTFTPGVNVCLAANERGKSTLAAGLAAIIYGLPSTSDPKTFGQERFRNWHDPARFSGELELEVGDEQFRLHRNFDNHRVSLQRLVNGHWQEEIGGEHNPRAQKRHVRYEERITQLLGVGSRELFTATFQVTQPLPEGEKIVPGIQQLLSGAGAHYKEALGSLTEELKKITRFTGRLGVTPRDMTQDRLLEFCEKEILRTEQDVTSAIQLLKDVQETGAILDDLQERSKKQAEELVEKERLLSAWREWRFLRDRYQEAATRQAALTGSLEKATLLDSAVREKTLIIKKTYSEFKGSPPDTGEVLVAFSAMREELTLLAGNLAETSEKISLERASIAQLTALLSDELAAVRDRPDLLHSCRELRRLEEEQRRFQEKTILLSEQLADLSGRLLCFPALDRLGKSPVQALLSLRAQCRTLLPQGQQFMADLTRLAELEERIEHEYGLFVRANNEVLAALSAYETHKMRLEAELERLNTARSAVLRKVEEVQSRHKLYQHLFAETDRLGDDAITLVERKLELLAAKREQEESLRQVRTKVASVCWQHRAGISLVALLSGLAAYFIWPSLSMSLLTGGLMALLLLALLCLFSRKKERSLPQSRLSEINAEMKQVDSLLGSFSVSNEAQLGELRLRLVQRQEARQQLSELQAALPGEEELRPLKAEIEAAKEACRAFNEMVSAAENQYVNIPAAYRQWRELEREADELQRRIADFAANQAAVTAPSSLPDVSPSLLSSPWPGIVILAELWHGSASTVRDALVWLATLEASWWEETEKLTSSFEKLQEVYQAIKLELTALTDPESEVTWRQDSLQQEIAALCTSLSPFDGRTDPLLLESLLARSREAEEELSRHCFALDALLEQQAELEQKRLLIDEKLQPLQERLSPLLAVGAPPAEVLLRWQEYSLLSRLSAEEEKELIGILSAHDASSLGGLRSKATDSDNLAVSILRQWEDLLKLFPALPLRENEDPESLEKQYRHLESRAAWLREEDEKLYSSIREWELRLAKLQGQAPSNIAGGELKLQKLREERHGLRKEAAALELAYKELLCAIEFFSSTYRQGLADKATAYFAKLSGILSRQVLLDEQFNISINEDGKTAILAQLSQGARDQLYLALRLAVADLLADEIQLPFIFDDPFLNWDEIRLSNMQEALHDMPGSRQVLLFSHRQDFASWGTACQPDWRQT